MLTNTESMGWFDIAAVQLRDPDFQQAGLAFLNRFARSEAAMMTVLYIVMQPVLKAYYGKGEKYEKHKSWWKNVMWAYNVLMSLFSFACFVAMVMVVTDLPLFTEDCAMYFRDSQIFYWTVYAFYISKFVEYLDTVFLIVMGRQVTWLQWLHHLGAAVNLWTLFTSRGEPVWIFVLFNSFIHTIMYAYYACSIRKINILPKTLITSMQIAQFLYGFRQLYYYKDVSCFVNDPVRMWGTWYYTWAYVSMVLGLFLNFFLVNYVIKKGGKKGSKVAKKQE